MTQIKIAPSRKEKADIKKAKAQLDILASENAVNGNPVSYRHQDLFIGGPLDGQVCQHQPNGKRTENDPEGYWADYFIKDVYVPPNKDGAITRVPGYHIYSTARMLEQMGTWNLVRPEHRPRLNLGTRGPLNRKCYYHIGFLPESELVRDGWYPSEFTGILTLS